MMAALCGVFCGDFSFGDKGDPRAGTAMAAEETRVEARPLLGGWRLLLLPGRADVAGAEETTPPSEGEEVGAASTGPRPRPVGMLNDLGIIHNKERNIMRRKGKT